MSGGFHFDTLYPFQDQALSLLRTIETDFYLTGGTAASRGYLEHRFSDDLDLFVNDDPRFMLWADRIIQGLAGSQVWKTEVTLRDERFVRILGLSIDAALAGAQGKAAGLFPADVARLLLSASEEDWKLVRWIEPPPAARFVEDLHRLGESLLLIP